MRSEKVLAYQLGVSIPMLALGALLMGERMAAMPGAASLGWLAYRGAASFMRCGLPCCSAVRRADCRHLPSRRPLFGVGSGHFVLGEPVSWAFGPAVALVIGGLILVNRPG
jgi:drug/metabolite transporter (DMT)-like permease